MLEKSERKESKINKTLLIVMAVGLIAMNIAWSLFLDGKGIQYEVESEKNIFMSLKFTGNQSKFNTFVAYAYYGDDEKQTQINHTGATYNLLSGYRSKKPECFKISVQTLKNRNGGPEKKIRHVLEDFTKQPSDLCK